MDRETADYVRGKCRVIAINSQGIDNDVNGQVVPAFAPWADVLYAADAKWWVHYAERALAFKGLKVTLRLMDGFEDVMSLELSTRVPFDPRPTHLVTGGNGGYSAVHLAAHYGVNRILLCGYDMRQIGTKKHWFGDYPGKLNTMQKYTNWIANFQNLFPILKLLGIEVINCTPKSALLGVKFKPLREVL